MGSMNYPIFTGKEVPEDWLADYELFMLSMQVVNDEGKLCAIPLVLRGEVMKSFQCQFEASWRQLEEVTTVQHGNYFKLKSFRACLHPKVREKVDLEGPNTFEEALSLACQKSKKIKRKWE